MYLFVFIEAKNDGSGGDSWSYRSCIAPVYDIALELTRSHTGHLVNSIAVVQTAGCTVLRLTVVRNSFS